MRRFSRRFWFALPPAVLVGVACGARTGLDIGPSAPGPDAGSPDAAPDVAEPVDAAGDADAAGPCTTNAECAGGDYCNVATCDPAVGCMLVPRDCDDGNPCTLDTCDEARKSCEHALDDGLCSSSELCSPTRGCAPFVYAVAADGHLYEVDVPSGQTHDVGATPAFGGDIALEPDGTLYLTDSYILYTVDRRTAATTTVGSIMPLHQYNSLGSQPDGSLQAMADVALVFDVGVMSANATPIASLPTGYFEGGDLTSAGGQSFATLTLMPPPATDLLAVIDPASKSTQVLGDTQETCVWGLATLGGVIYGLTCQGLVLTIDATTGQSTRVGSASPAFQGAAGR